MTGSAKQSTGQEGRLDCFVAEFIIGPAEGGSRWLLAMTVLRALLFGKRFAVRKQCTAATFFRLAKSLMPGEHPTPTQSRAELQMKEAAMGQDVRSPRGPRCIA